MTDETTLEADGDDGSNYEQKWERTSEEWTGEPNEIDPYMTVEEAARPDETVEDRLRGDMGCQNLLAWSEGRIAEHLMTYEDFVRPLKLTGGKVCLRVEGPGYDNPWYYRRRSEGLQVHDPMARRWDCMIAVRSIRKDMATDDRTITPVRVEDTPFGGE